MSIPVEVVEDILSRIPVECLLRFRCVCPPWRDLIDSPRFVKLHLYRSIKTETNLNLLLKDRNRKHSLHAANFNPSILSLEAKELHHHPLRDAKHGKLQVLGHSNGLICLSDDICYGKNPCSGDDDVLIPVGTNSHTTILIWNPSTQRYVTLPSTKFDSQKDGPESDYFHVYSFAFGYDRVGDDYKFSMLMDMIKIGTRVRVYGVKVYSLNAHSWHSVEVSFNNLPYMKSEPGQSATNALHWTLNLDQDNPGVIVAFDFQSETCRIVPGPRSVGAKYHVAIHCFQDSISAYYTNCLGLLDLWVMREYGVQESWTKLLSLKPKITRPFYFPLKKREGVFMQHDGKLLWMDTGNGKTCYNMDEDGTEQDKVKNIEVRGLKYFEKVYPYVGSLVPLGRFSRMSYEKKPNQKKNNDVSGFLSKGFKLKL